MKFKECRRLIASDLSRLKHVKWGVKYLITNASFKITFWFRIGQYLRLRNDFVSKILYGFVCLIYKHYQFLTGIQLPLSVNVGAGLVFSHYSCIIINGSTTIGDNCTIFQGVTIGSVRGAKGGVPVIGDNVVISSGAKIIGNVRVGNNVMIGAGAVVVSDIPDNAVAVGVPAKVISYKGYEHTQLYLRN